MISCDAFRVRFEGSTEDPAVLGHLRECDRCLDFAAQTDPDVMFRALGGGEMIPPGGVEAFVVDVMQQVRVRSAESTVTARHEVSWTRRLAIAATLAVGITGAMVYNQLWNPGPTGSQPVASITASPVRTFTTKPIVETYESDRATIVEVPSEGAADDVKIVMIFDENLPADL
ncbi:MAG TPA: hypothetical protein VGQ76_23540 [Thermoanaerobaculia bacterium]|jgi:hypothetical protein|nr:hypothetical protein [Thermoanaerobaculia bacterium]